MVRSGGRFVDSKNCRVLPLSPSYHIEADFDKRWIVDRISLLILEDISTSLPNLGPLKMWGTHWMTTMESYLGFIKKPGEKGGGIDVPTRSSGPLAFSNLSQASSPAGNVKVSIVSYLECDGINETEY